MNEHEPGVGLEVLGGHSHGPANGVSGETAVVTVVDGGSGATQAEFAARLAEHRGILYRIANLYCPSPEERDDLVQEICLQLWRSYSRYDPERRFSTWMYRVALNTAISFGRSTQARLRVVRARSNRWLLLSAPLLWALLVIVVPHGLLGVDIYRVFGLSWVIGNLAVGFAVIGAPALLSRWFPAIGGSAFVRWIGDDMTGRRVAAASAFLGELAEFEAAEG